MIIINHLQTKQLYHITTDSTQLKVRCWYNIKLNTMGINASFGTSKSIKRPTNIKSGYYLGCQIAEKILQPVFKNVQVMPPCHKGYDIICNYGHFIDIKSATINTQKGWYFKINKNTIADYFLCLAFDDRINLNPKHLWLIPGKVINHLTGASIHPNTLNKWSQYELTGKHKDVISCCNIMKGDIK